jgi:hypothetical protein
VRLSFAIVFVGFSTLNNVPQSLSVDGEIFNPSLYVNGTNFVDLIILTILQLSLYHLSNLSLNLDVMF